MSSYVLLDRDGVINRRPGNHWVTRWEEFHFLPRATEALRRLTEHRFRIVIVSNQSGVGRGHFTNEALQAITRKFLKEIEQSGTKIEAVYYCPHRPEDNCDCRKPKPGLLRQAQKEHGFDFTKTYLVGDSERDLEAGAAVGCPVIRVDEKGEGLRADKGPKPRAVVRNLYDAVEYILKQPASGSL